MYYKLAQEFINSISSKRHPSTFDTLYFMQVFSYQPGFALLSFSNTCTHKIKKFKVLVKWPCIDGSFISNLQSTFKELIMYMLHFTVALLHVHIHCMLRVGPLVVGALIQKNVYA